MSNSGLSAAIQMAAQLSLDFPEMGGPEYWQEPNK
jgi:hypothetical protein